MLSYSQNSLKSINNDSILISYPYLISANKAFIEAKNSRIIIEDYNNLIQSKNIEIQNYIKSLEECRKANDTLSQVVIPLMARKSKDYRLLYEDFKKGYNKERTQKIALSISLPVALVIGFVVGFLVH